MTVTDVTKDPSALTLSIVATFGSPIERVWQLVADARQLERWWGPPEYPATFAHLDLVAGGSAAYHMTAPDGRRSHGWWRVVSVDPPRRLEVEDGFADDTGAPRSDMPVMRMVMTLEERAEGGTRFEVRTQFASEEAMERLTSMGIEEGMRLAMGQMDDVLAS